MDATEILREVKKHLPHTWEPTNYDEIAERFKIGRGDTEYNEVITPFPLQRLTIDKVERIQHLYKYGQYLLRKLQIETRHGHEANESIVYHAVSACNVAVAIETSCDVRRYQNTGKIPKLYSSPEKALESLNSLREGSSQCAVIVLKQLKSSEYDIYPAYVVYLEN